MGIKTSEKLSQEGISFLKNLRKNRIKMDIDQNGLSYWKLLELIGKYFKSNNDRYLELVKTKEGDNNGMGR